MYFVYIPVLWAKMPVNYLIISPLLTVPSEYYNLHMSKETQEPKKLIATNCTLIALPKGCSAKIDGKGTAIITVPANFESDLRNPSYSSESFILGIHFVSLDETNISMIGLAPADFDESGFYDILKNE